ncbi:MAG: chemotaxis protein CheW [Proteobacteria bacterium]|nr:chemotaxis protein CheW [Pseudomonadota bacterium]MBU0967676.1 chemotaxis protein CheW [Pseudomonadota bacterium]
MANVERAQSSVKKNVKALAGKYLTFDLGKEEYCIGILKVREIIGLMEITAVPHTPRYIKGVINLRGSVIPVLDLRSKFDMEAKEYTERTCIIVVEVQGETETVLVGMIVDSVSEVLNIVEAEIEPPPTFGGDAVETDNFLGMAKIKGRVKILLDTDKVIGETGLGHMANVAA